MADAAYSNLEADQEEVDGAAELLRAAIDSLEPAGSPDPENPDTETPGTGTSDPEPESPFQILRIRIQESRKGILRMREHRAAAWTERRQRLRQAMRPMRGTETHRALQKRSGREITLILRYTRQCCLPLRQEPDILSVEEERKNN